MNDKKKDKKNNKEQKPDKPKIIKVSGYSAYIYLALAICIVTALTIGIYTMSFNLEEISEIPEISVPDISLPDISIPDISEAPAGGEESNVDVIIEEPEPIYVNPIESGEIIKDFTVKALVFSETMRDYRIHTGVDIAAELGSAVYCYTDGTIAEIKDDPFFGTTVIVQHSFGLTSYYMNLAPEIPEGVVAGAAVKAGDIIGAVGSTAKVEQCDPPHLHFELTVGDELIDPKPELMDIE